MIVRLYPDGGVDPSFEMAQGVNGTISSVAIQSDGRILVAGEFTDYSGIPRHHIARLNADGSLDFSFDPGSGAQDELHVVGVRPDGRILIAGALSRYDGYVRYGIAGLLADGRFDKNFNPASSANGTVNAIAVQPDDRVLITGSFTAYGDMSRNRIARLEMDGSLDTSFDPGLGPNSEIWALALQADGKSVIGGLFTSYDGVPCGRVARVNTDGKLDTTYHTGTGANGQVVSLARGPDDKVLVSGNFSSFNGVARKRLVRLNLDGSVDQDFDPGAGPSSVVWSFAWQPDGKILIVGNFTSYDSTARNHVARLNADGSLDPSFDPGSGLGDRAVSVAVQTDGKILVGGFFHDYNGISRHGIVRLNADGSLDASFDPGAGIAGQESGWDRIYSIIPRTDGRILIGGDFATYDGSQRNRIAQLNADGSLDTSFDPGSGANGIIIDMELLSDGRVLVGGYFTSYGGALRSRIARVLGSFDFSETGPLLVFPNPVLQNSALSIALDLPVGYVSRGPWHLELTDATGRRVGVEQVSSNAPWTSMPAPGASGLYHLKLWDGSGFEAAARFVVE